MLFNYQKQLSSSPNGNVSSTSWGKQPNINEWNITDFLPQYEQLKKKNIF